MSFSFYGSEFNFNAEELCVHTVAFLDVVLPSFVQILYLVVHTVHFKIVYPRGDPVVSDENWSSVSHARRKRQMKLGGFSE